MRERLKEIVEEEMEMNMTPMIDVVFLLIIFFLCIDFKVLEAKLQAYLPKDVGAMSTEVEPQEKLRIKILCDNWGTEVPRRQLTAQEVSTGKRASFALRNHRVHYEVGPQRFDTIKELTDELRKIAADPTKQVPDKEKPGQTKLIGVVVEPYPRTTYGDVAHLLDAIHDAGPYNDISFGGGLARRKQ